MRTAGVLMHAALLVVIVAAGALAAGARGAPHGNPPMRGSATAPRAVRDGGGVSVVFSETSEYDRGDLRLLWMANRDRSALLSLDDKRTIRPTGMAVDTTNMLVYVGAEPWQGGQDGALYKVSFDPQARTAGQPIALGDTSNFGNVGDLALASEREELYLVMSGDVHRCTTDGLELVTFLAIDGEEALCVDVDASYVYVGTDSGLHRQDYARHHAVETLAQISMTGISMTSNGLYFSHAERNDPGYLGLMQVDSGNHTVVVSGIPHPSDVAASVEEDVLCWVDEVDSDITCVAADGSGHHHPVVSGLDNCSFLKLAPMLARPPAGEMLSAVDPITMQESDSAQTLTVNGLVPTPSVFMALVPAPHGDCTVEGQRVGVTQYGALGSVDLTMDDVSDGHYLFCVNLNSANGVDGTWTLQTSPGVSFFVWGTSTVTALVPSRVPANGKSQGVELVGAPVMAHAWAAVGRTTSEMYPLDTSNVIPTSFTNPGEVTIGFAITTSTQPQQGDFSWQDNVRLHAWGESSLKSISPRRVAITDDILYTIELTDDGLLSNHTYISLHAEQHSCTDARYVWAVTLLDSLRLRLSEPIGTSGKYTLCYSENGNPDTLAGDWFDQSNPYNNALEVTVWGEDLVTFSPTRAAAGSTDYEITLTDAEPGGETYLAFVVNATDCTDPSKRFLMTNVRDDRVKVDGALPDDGSIVLCYSEDARNGQGGLWVPQTTDTLSVWGSHSLTGLRPWRTSPATQPTVTLEGDFATGDTALAFVSPHGGSCSRVEDRNAVTEFNSDSEQLEDALSVEGSWTVCYTENYGSDLPTWFSQLHATMFVWGEETIQSISPRHIGVGTRATITVPHAYASSKTALAFVVHGNDCTNADHRLSLVPITAGHSGRMTHPLTSSDAYDVCYTEDDDHWFKQAQVSATVFGPASVTHFSPSDLLFGAHPFIVVEGVPASLNTFVALALTNTLCTEQSARLGVTQYVSQEGVHFTGGLELPGRYKLCLTEDSTNGLDGTWFEQTAIPLISVVCSNETVGSRCDRCIAGVYGPACQGCYEVPGSSSGCPARCTTCVKGATRYEMLLRGSIDELQSMGGPGRIEDGLADVVPLLQDRTNAVRVTGDQSTIDVVVDVVGDSEANAFEYWLTQNTTEHALLRVFELRTVEKFDHDGHEHLIFGSAPGLDQGSPTVSTLYVYVPLAGLLVLFGLVMLLRWRIRNMPRVRNKLLHVLGRTETTRMRVVGVVGEVLDAVDWATDTLWVIDLWTDETLKSGRDSIFPKIALVIFCATILAHVARGVILSRGLARTREYTEARDRWMKSMGKDPEAATHWYHVNLLKNVSALPFFSMFLFVRFGDDAVKEISMLRNRTRLITLVVEDFSQVVFSFVYIVSVRSSVRSVLALQASVLTMLWTAFSLTRPLPTTSSEAALGKPLVRP